jgi:hypothetical protein
MAKATSISAANLAKFTQSAVKAATAEIPGRLVTKGPTMGYTTAEALSPARALKLATTIAAGISETARAAGVSGIKPKPVVITRPGGTTLGFIAQELGLTIRG